GGSVAGLGNGATVNTGTGTGWYYGTNYCTNVGSSWCSAVQSWADGGGNYGFRIRNDGATGTGKCHQQILYYPSMSFNYYCRSGFEEVSNACTSCGPTNRGNCVDSQSGNSCTDVGGTSLPAYHCKCNTPAYTTNT